MLFICLIFALFNPCCHIVRLIIGIGFLCVSLNTGYGQQGYVPSVQSDSYHIATDSLPRIEFRKNTVLKPRTRFDVWIDPTQNTTIDFILQHPNLPFQRTESDILSLGYQHATVWCRFVVRYYDSTNASNNNNALHSAVEQSTTHKEPFVLYTMNRQADTAIFICVNPATGVVCYADTNGYSIPYNRWSIKHDAIAFLIPDNEHLVFARRLPHISDHKGYKDMVCYLQFRTSSVSIISLRAVEYDTFFSTSAGMQSLEFIYHKKKKCTLLNFTR